MSLYLGFNQNNILNSKFLFYLYRSELVEELYKYNSFLFISE